MDTPAFDFINFAVEGGGTRHYDLPILRRVNWTTVLIQNLSLIGLFLLLLSPDIYTRIKHPSIKNIPICHQGQDYLDSGCFILSDWLFYISLIFCCFFGFLLISTIIRLIRLSKTNGPTLKADAHSFWCDELMEPIKFERVESITKLYSGREVLRGLRFKLDSHVEFALERKWGWGTGKKSDFYWSPIGYSDRIGLINAIVFLFDEYKSTPK